ncbi:MarR family winged helix-turn-helix transcriptional regulator [Streptomyces mirabilis]|uniref:MarR family winged helix-turn-helix transcriptional regulator n=1 Tax=Streptomyces mirabilis TaxID=68239 RepID=UPI001BB097B9|nr:MarR family winged helix-turn-helix transcriptional regulator [Streptomyces mirabilis]
METEARGLQSAEPPSPADGGDGGDGDDDGRGVDQGIDRELLDWWMLVRQGFHATQQCLVSELAERFNVGQAAAGVLLRLLTTPKHRMPMTRLAHEARMSSGGFTKLADRLCAAGLARRLMCEDDRRLIYLELTDQGEDTAQAISEAVTQILRARVLTPLGRDGFGELADAMRELRDANDDLGK